MIRAEYVNTWFAGEKLAERTQPFAVVTACNPLGQLLSWADNARRDEKLLRRLNGLGHNPCWVFAGSRDWSHFEPSWAVPNMTQEEGAALGRVFGQDAIFWIANGDVLVRDCDSAAQVLVGKWSERCKSFWNPQQSRCIYVITLDAAVWSKKKFAERTSAVIAPSPATTSG